MTNENAGRLKRTAQDPTVSTAHAGSDSRRATTHEKQHPQESVDAETGIQIGQRPRCGTDYALTLENTGETGGAIA